MRAPCCSANGEASPTETEQGCGTAEPLPLRGRPGPRSAVPETVVCGTAAERVVVVTAAVVVGWWSMGRRCSGQGLQQVGTAARAGKGPMTAGTGQAAQLAHRQGLQLRPSCPCGVLGDWGDGKGLQRRWGLTAGQRSRWWHACCWRGWRWWCSWIGWAAGPGPAVAEQGQQQGQGRCEQVAGDGFDAESKQDQGDSGQVACSGAV